VSVEIFKSIKDIEVLSRQVKRIFFLGAQLEDKISYTPTEYFCAKSECA
jgi:hypothetical protein